MRLYLVQHGEALPKEVDPERPLSSAGRQDIERLADLLQRHGVQVARVLHSGKMRAAQTAAILAASLAPAMTAELSGLGPSVDPAIVSALVPGWCDDTLMVGHLPHLSALVGLLVTGAATATVVSYTRPGTLVGLERAPDTGAWSVIWVLPPDLVEA